MFKRMILRSAAGEEVTIDVEPARPVSSDDGARVWILSDRIHAGDSPFAPLAALSVFGKPFTVSECGNNPPKAYRAAYYPGLAAIACLQG